MAIEFVGASTMSAGAGSPPPVSRPNGLMTGDMLIAFHVSVAASPVVPGAFNLHGEIFPINLSASNQGIMCYRPIFDIDSEPESYEFASGASGNSVIIAAYRGVDASAPFAVAAPSYYQRDSTTSVIAPSIEVQSPGAWLVIGHGAYSGLADRVPATPPGMSRDAGLVGRAQSVFGEALIAAGATGERDLVWTTSTAAGGIVTALRPAGATPARRFWSAAQIIE